MTPETSLGFSAITFAEVILKITLFPWQKWLLIHALELRAEGGFRFRNVVVLVARQNGKSTLSQVLALWFMYVYGYDLVLGTAQDLDTAEEVWQGAVDLVTETDLDDEPLRPELFELYQRTVMVNGKKSLELKTGARYKAKAASRRSGRGLSGDLIMLDELREHQNWDAWGAITKTTMARDEAMVWALSNAGDSLSIVLAYLRKLGHTALGDPDGINADGSAADLIAAELDAESMELDEEDDSLAIFEWSAPPGCDIWDRDGWAQGNPSLGYTITERTIASAARTDPEPVFRTEVLCQWVEQLDSSAIDMGMWNGRADVAAKQGQQVVFAVATAPDRSWSAIAAAWQREDGATQVSLVDYQPLTGWVKDKLLAEGAVLKDVIVDSASRGLLPGAQEPALAEQAKAHNALSDAVVSGTVWHDDLPALNMSVRASRWRAMGDSRVLDRKGNNDISPLIAAALAAYAVTSAPPADPGVYVI